MPYLQVNGVNHYYDWITATGQPPAGDKPVMVFIHGWAGSARYWETTAETMKSQFDCLLYDLRGFGRSRLPRDEAGKVPLFDYELETYADDLAVMLDSLGLQKIYLNAHSTGASVAVYFLNRYAERVHRAILTCNGVFEYDEKAFEAFYRFGRYVVAFRPNWLLSIPLMPRVFMARFLKRSLPYQDCRNFMEDFLTADYEAALGTIYTAVSQRATEVMPQEFAKIKVPTLLVSGEFDKIIPAEMGRQAADLSDQVEHVVIPGTAHFPMLEDPDTYGQAVDNFLQPALQV